MIYAVGDKFTADIAFISEDQYTIQKGAAIDIVDTNAQTNSYSCIVQDILVPTFYAYISEFALQSYCTQPLPIGVNQQGLWGQTGGGGGIGQWITPQQAQNMFPGGIAPPIEADLGEIVPVRPEFHFSKCECGSTAVGSDKHSDYCPLYKINNFKEQEPPNEG